MFFREMLVLVVVLSRWKSVCGLRLSRMIGFIFLSFVLCFWFVDLVCWLVCGVFGVVVVLCICVGCVAVWVSCLFVCVWRKSEF